MANSIMIICSVPKCMWYKNYVVLNGNRIVHISAAKMNHIFVTNTRWRHHSSCVLRLDLIHFIIT